MNLPGNESILNTSQIEFKINSQHLNNKTLPPESIVFPKRGAAIKTNKKRITKHHSILDPNTIGIVIEDKNILPLYLYYWFLSIDISRIQDVGVTPQLNKKDLMPLEFPCPSVSTQKKISHILSKIQNKIENIDKHIESFASLKKSVMEKLFTEGLHNEKQKATEIGMIPESWNVVSISDAFVFTSKSRALQVVAPIPFIPMELIGDGSNIYVHNYNLKEKVSSGTYFDNDDLLVAKITPSFENGKQSIANIDKDYGYATTEVIPIKSTSTANNLFLFHYLKRDSIRKDLAGKMEGSTGRQRLSKSILGATKIPIPSTSEQKDIAQILTEYDIKIQILQRTKSQYHDLFSSLLNKLMINEISTDELEFKERSSSHE